MLNLVRLPISDDAKAAWAPELNLAPAPPATNASAMTDDGSAVGAARTAEVVIPIEEKPTRSYRR